MNRLVDPHQTHIWFEQCGSTHIWFEQCGSCRGSFFDAGELTDLTTVSFSDLFKRFASPVRK
jgi:Zn-finger nucleic acid-binding protein